VIGPVAVHAPAGVAEMPRTPRRRGWWARALLWAVSGCVAGPLALGIVGAVSAMIGVPGQKWGVTQAFASVVVTTIFGTVVGIVAAAPVYLPLLLLWAANGSRLGRIESTYWGVLAATGLLAAAGAALLTVMYGSMESPFGFRGADLVTYAWQMLLLLWAGLVLPRLALPALWPGAFGLAPATAVR
jgi:hypothetical protein